MADGSYFYLQQIPESTKYRSGSFCEYAGPWEYSGYAIMEVNSGKITMKSF